MFEDHEQFPLDSTGPGGPSITPAGRFYTVIEFERYDRFAICAGARWTVIRRFSTRSDFRSGWESSALPTRRALWGVPGVRRGGGCHRRSPAAVTGARPLCGSNILLARALSASQNSALCVHREIPRETCASVYEKLPAGKIERCEVPGMEINANCAFR